jgi:hypothetical protein
MINMAKLNFKSNALFASEKYEMHDMIVDTCDEDEMIPLSSSGGAEGSTSTVFSSAIPLGEGYVAEIDLSSYKNVKKVEVI